MRFNFPFSLLLLILIFACNEPSDNSKPLEYMKYEQPSAKKIKHIHEAHGDERVDYYNWMRLSDEQKNADSLDAQTQDVVDYLEEENAYTDKALKNTEELQQTIYDEIVGRIQQTDMSVPYVDNGYFYLTRFEDGKEYPIYARKKGNLESEEEILLNVNTLAEDFEYYQVGSTQVSPNNKVLAYSEDNVSRRVYTIKFKDLESDELLADVIPNTSGSVVWANDNKTVFYAVRDATLRSYKIFRHTLGTDASKDVEVYHEEDDTFVTFVYKSKTSNHIIIGSYATMTSEFRVLDANNPTGKFKIFQPRERGLEYSIFSHQDQWYVVHNGDAKNFMVSTTPTNATTKDNWKTLIEHRDDVLVESLEVFQNFLVVNERIAGITELRVIPKTGDEYYIEFNDAAHLVYAQSNKVMDTDILRFGYTSMTTPNSTYDFNLNSKERTLLKQQEVVGGFESSEYTSERRMVKARDGVEVPISIVYKNTTPVDGTAPALLYGYGSYGNSMDPSFSSVRLSILDRGFVFVIAHIRGGSELGRGWYEDGKLLKKKNTFNDFIDCAHYLSESKLASKDAIYAMGGSAGGLLMGAIINDAPELWRGVIAAVPFVDVVSTMMDETIPLTTGEFDEWGNPKDKTYYDYIKSYSPYDNVEAKDYPNMLITTGYHDSQVQYWEPAKWIAKLREVRTDKNMLLLHTNMGAGHGGQSGRFRRYKETALSYAFMINLQNQ